MLARHLLRLLVAFICAIAPSLHAQVIDVDAPTYLFTSARGGGLTVALSGRNVYVDTSGLAGFGLVPLPDSIAVRGIVACRRVVVDPQGRYAYVQLDVPRMIMRLDTRTMEWMHCRLPDASAIPSTLHVDHASRVIVGTDAVNAQQGIPYGIYMSDDHGMTWTRIDVRPNDRPTSIGITSIATFPDGRLVVAGRSRPTPEEIGIYAQGDSGRWLRLTNAVSDVLMASSQLYFQLNGFVSTFVVDADTLRPQTIWSTGPNTRKLLHWDADTVLAYVAMNATHTLLKIVDTTVVDTVTIEHLDGFRYDVGVHVIATAEGPMVMVAANAECALIGRDGSRMRSVPTQPNRPYVVTLITTRDQAMLDLSHGVVRVDSTGRSIVLDAYRSRLPSVTGGSTMADDYVDVVDGRTVVRYEASSPTTLMTLPAAASSFRTNRAGDKAVCIMGGRLHTVDLESFTTSELDTTGWPQVFSLQTQTWSPISVDAVCIVRDQIIAWASLSRRPLAGETDPSGLYAFRNEQWQKVPLRDLQGFNRCVQVTYNDDRIAVHVVPSIFGPVYSSAITTWHVDEDSAHVIARPDSMSLVNGLCVPGSGVMWTNPDGDLFHWSASTRSITRYQSFEPVGLIGRVGRRVLLATYGYGVLLIDDPQPTSSVDDAVLRISSDARVVPHPLGAGQPFTIRMACDAHDHLSPIVHDMLGTALVQFDGRLVIPQPGYYVLDIKGKQCRHVVPVIVR